MLSLYWWVGLNVNGAQEYQHTRQVCKAATESQLGDKRVQITKNRDGEERKLLAVRFPTLTSSHAAAVCVCQRLCVCVCACVGVCLRSFFRPTWSRMQLHLLHLPFMFSSKLGIFVSTFRPFQQEVHGLRSEDSSCCPSLSKSLGSQDAWPADPKFTRLLRTHRKEVTNQVQQIRKGNLRLHAGDVYQPHLSRLSFAVILLILISFLD